MPWGTLIDQPELIGALERNKGRYSMQGTDKGKAIVINSNASGVLKMITQDVLDADTTVANDVPISYGQQYAAAGGTMIYVLDEAAAAEVLAQQQAIKAKGYTIVDMRGKPYPRVESLVFTRNPETNLMG